MADKLSVHAMVDTIRFTVLGEPVAKARPRVGNGHAYTPEATRTWEQAVGWAALQARGAAGIAEPVAGPVAVTMEFRVSEGSRADIDNLAKAVLDALNGIIYADDSQVHYIAARRLLAGAEPPAASVTVSFIGEREPDGS